VATAGTSIKGNVIQGPVEGFISSLSGSGAAAAPCYAQALVGTPSVFARGAALTAAALIAACGAGSHPPPLGDEPRGDAGAEGGGLLISDAGPIIQSCGKGPDGGVCACVDEPLALDAPTLYFALDRSGSMNDGNKWGTIRSVIANLVTSLGQRAKFGAAVLPDPKMDQCATGGPVWPMFGVAPLQGDGTLGTPGPRDQSLIETLDGIDANGGTPTAATLEGLLPKLRQWGGKTYLVFATDGGPNCDSSATCGASGCTLNIEGTAGCVPTGPSCCGPGSLGGSDSCLDAEPTLAAVMAFSAAGIPVYVLGVPGSEPYAVLLDELAVAGGTARGSEPQYYAVSSFDQAAFASAMSQIAAKVTGSCTLVLNAVPPQPDEVNVFLNGAAIAQTGPDGWTLAGTTVTILGKSCQAILDGDVVDVRVVAGCPTVTH